LAFLEEVRQILRSEFDYEYRLNSIKDIRDALAHIKEFPQSYGYTANNTISGIKFAEIKRIIETFDASQDEQCLTWDYMERGEQAAKTAEPGNSDRESKFLNFLKENEYLQDNPAANGKYDLLENAEKTVYRIMFSSFHDHEDWKFLPLLLDKYTNTYCTIETLKRYVRNNKKTIPDKLKCANQMEKLKARWKDLKPRKT